MKRVVCFVVGMFINTFVYGETLEIVNIRVGQGDSTLILGPPDASGNRVTVLFDAGDIPQRDGGNILRAVLYKWGVRDIDFFILSHDDADHIGGIVSGGRHGESFVLGWDGVPGSLGDDDGDGAEDWLGDTPFFLPDPDELGLGDDIPIAHFVDYGDELMRDTQAIRKYQGIANAMGERITLDSQDDVDQFEIDLGNDAKMVLYAANGFVRGRAGQVSNVNRPNEQSLSFLVSYKDFDYLISGDLIGRSSGSENARVEEAVGQAIVNDGKHVDILHVNHHGANNASSRAFLDLIRPEMAIISAGNRNDFSHPRHAVLKRLVESGVYRIYQTSWGTTRERISSEVRDHQAIYQNDVIIRTNGREYEISTSRTFPSDG